MSLTDSGQTIDQSVSVQLNLRRRQWPDRQNTAIRTRGAHTALEALLPNADLSKADYVSRAADARTQDQQSSRSAHLNDNPRSCWAYPLAFESSICACTHSTLFPLADVEYLPPTACGDLRSTAGRRSNPAGCSSGHN